ncbi:MAG: IPT/TIG domain-containing protein [Anaerolineae bacterium]|nr:IPT/TIG domain-containing protein [Candidatus Roseilinea sp.]MDW8449620.1 IPT/TIG domain-containing protein [Anaerolineae bacterium]
MKRVTLPFVALTLLTATVVPTFAQRLDPSLAEIKTARWQARAALAIPEPTPADEAPLPFERAGAQATQNVAADTRIVFQSFRDGNWEIYRANGDGSGVLRLTATPAADVEPRLSRNGQKIVFASNRTGNFELYVMNWDGSGLQQLTNTPFEEREPVWSADGTKIAFSTNRDGNIEIYTMNANGSGQTRISNHPNPDFAPTWSPANDYIAWVRAVNATDGQLIRYDISNGAEIPTSAPLRFLDTPVYQSSPNLYGSPGIAFSADVNGDNFNDITTLGGSTIVATTGGLTDYFMGSWTPGDTGILFTQVNYREENNQLVPTEWLINHKSFVGSSAISNYYIAGNAEANADWRWNDTQAPQVRVYEPSGAARPFGSSVTVKWSGTDVGPSGVLSYEVQVRQGSGAWQTWISNTLATEGFWFIGAPSLLQFRARAIDRVGNVAPWGPDDRYDVEFIPYNYKIDGRITDNRNQGLAEVAVNSSPSPIIAPLKTNASGDFIGYFATGGEYQLAFSRTGYGQFAAWRYLFTGFTDFALANYLPPQTSAIANGDFELTPALTNWQTTGNAEGLTSQRSNGLQAARLYVGCSWPCTITETLLGSGSRRDWTIGPDGTQHLVWEDFPAAAIFYASRPANGSWSAPVQIDGAPTPNPSAGREFRIALDGLGDVHIVHTAFGPLRYIRRAGSGWQSPLELTQQYAERPTLAADANGRVHLAYVSFASVPGNLKIVYREGQAGVWQPPLDLTSLPASSSDYSAVDRVQMVTGPDGKLHLLFRNWSSDSATVAYRTKLPGSGFVSEALPINGPAVRPVSAFADASGGIHILLTVEESAAFGGSGKLYYAARPAGGSWGALEFVDDVKGSGLLNASLVVDAAGRRHIAYLKPDPTTLADLGASYIIRDPGGPTSPPLKFSSGDQSKPVITFGPSGDVFLFVRPLWGTTILRIPLANQAGASAISQVVTVPAGANKPTLAFMHQLRGILPSYDSALRVKVTDSAGTQTPLAKKTPAGDWTLQWLDMSAWAGKTVTITLELAQAAGAPYAEAWLDAVSLGEWNTPVLTQVTPAKLPGNQPGTTITLTGLNFIAPPSVRLGNISLSDVQFVDETTVRATVPAGTPPGLYDVTIVNPGGQSATRVGAVQIGERAVMPIVLR